MQKDGIQMKNLGTNQHNETFPDDISDTPREDLNIEVQLSPTGQKILGFDDDKMLGKGTSPNTPNRNKDPDSPF